MSKPTQAASAAPRTASAILAEQAAEQDALRTAEADVEHLRAARPPLLLTAPDAELDRHDAAIRKAERQVERSKAKLAVLGADLEAARDVEDQAGRQALYAKAEQALKGAAGTVASKHAELVRLGREIVEILARADDAVRAANKRLPAGATPLPAAEAFRGSVTPPRLLHEQELDLWAHDNGEAVPLIYQEDILPFGKDGRLGRPRARADVNSAHVEYHRARFVQVRFEQARLVPSPGAFASNLHIPPLTGADRPGWSLDGEAWPGRVLARLAELNQAVTANGPLSRDELVPIAKLAAFKRVNGLS